MTYAYLDMKYKDRINHLKATELEDYAILDNPRTPMDYVQAWGRRKYLITVQTPYTTDWAGEMIKADHLIKDRIGK